MKKRCLDCLRVIKIYARGLCRNCYQRWWVNNSPIKYKKGNKKGSANYRKKNKEKIKAQNKARIINIPKNKLCEKCSKMIARDKHHEDYNKPLEVRFVYKQCHAKLRKNYRKF